MEDDGICFCFVQQVLDKNKLGAYFSVASKLSFPSRPTYDFLQTCNRNLIMSLRSKLS